MQKENFVDNYEVEKTLYKENPIEVAIVHDKNSKKYFSIKYLINPNNENQTEEIFELYKKFNFDGIMNLHSIAHDSQKNEDYFIFDYLAENNLLLSNYKTLTNTQKQIIMYQVASIIQQIHSQNYIVQDISLSNFLINDKFHPYLLFLGEASRVGEKVNVFSELPHVCPPEMKKDGDKIATFAIDSYALGGMFLMLVGGTFTALNFSLREFAPPPVFKPTLPQTLNSNVGQMILKLMEADPEKRLSIEDTIHQLKTTAILDDVDMKAYELILNSK